MNKAFARHTLLQGGWREPEIAMAVRVLRHDSSRRVDAVLPTLRTFAERYESGPERAAWDRLIARIEGAPDQARALVAMLAL